MLAGSVAVKDCNNAACADGPHGINKEHSNAFNDAVRAHKMRGVFIEGVR